MSSSPLPTIFISYSRHDEAWKNRLVEQLKVLEYGDRLEVWEDQRITAGSSWQADIDKALARASVAVFLVSARSLSSSFIRAKEIPRLLERRSRDGLHLIPVIIRPCLWRKVEWLAALECRPSGSQALSEFPKAKAERVLVGLAEEIDQLLAAVSSPSGSPASTFSAPPEPLTYADDAHRGLAEKLTAAQERLEELTISGSDTSLALEEILDLKRRLREGGHLKAGDFLLQGRFRLLDVLGQGGFATVWKAYDRVEQQLVAVKVLHGQYGHNRNRRDRFFRGARKMARLRHEGIVGVVEQECEDGGFHFFAMEYVSGGDLRQAVLEGRVPRSSALKVISRLGDALRYAHSQKVVHRDVKPANVLLDAAGNPKLTDFDLVRALDTTGGTRSGMMGTFVYAAPEALTRVQEAGPAADVYSLAMTAAFVLHGQELPLSIFRDPSNFIEGLDCDAGVRAALQKAAAWDVEDRFSSVEDFLKALSVSAVEDELGQPLHWATASGKDDFGLWASFEVGNVVQRLRWIAPGRFLMGSPADEAGRWKDEGLPREVTLTEGFWLADTPCTQALWEEVMGSNPSYFKGSDRPVEWVSWEDCQEFFRRLNDRIPGLEAGFPTEAQWEYACRAGTDTATCAPLDEIAWYSGNSREGTQPVGRKRPNPWGLYDVLGNVFEWCSDPWIVPGHRLRPKDERVIRGGSWHSYARDVRAAARRRSSATQVFDDLGLRVARP